MNDQSPPQGGMLRLVHSISADEEPAGERSLAALRHRARGERDVRPADPGIRRLVESLERIRRRGLLD